MDRCDPRATAQQRGALARSLVAVVSEFTGRGPNGIRVTIGQDLVCVVMRDNHTKGEQALLAIGERDLVAELRAAYHRAMKPSVIRVTREVTGRAVQSVFADHDPDADVSTFNFVLAPAAARLTVSARNGAARVRGTGAAVPVLS